MQVRLEWSREAETAPNRVIEDGVEVAAIFQTGLLLSIQQQNKFGKKLMFEASAQRYLFFLFSYNKASQTMKYSPKKFRTDPLFPKSLVMTRHNETK